MAGYSGRGSGGSNLNAEKLALFDHLSYNEVKNWIESDVAFSTTLSTIWLSDQWGFKSGGKSPFFSSTDQDTNFAPVMRGIKNQAVAGNQEEEGLISPFYRKNGGKLLQTSLKGAMSNNANDVTPYEGISLLTADIAVYGVRAVLGEELKTGDKLWYRLWDGTTDQGAKIFEQSLTVTADRAPGFDFIGWWSAPAEGFAGESVYARITVQPVDGSEERAILVRSVAGDVDTHWNELQIRTFEDLAIPSEPVIITENYTALNGDSLLIDTTAGAVTITVADSCNWFTIADHSNTWTNTNNVRVIVGTDTALFDQQASDEKYELKKEGSQYLVRSVTGEYMEALDI